MWDDAMEMQPDFHADAGTGSAEGVHFAQKRQLSWNKEKQSGQAVNAFSKALPEDAARSLALRFPVAYAKDLEAKTCQDHQICFWVYMWISIFVLKKEFI